MQVHFISLNVIFSKKDPVQQGPFFLFGQKWALTIIIYNQVFLTRLTPNWAWNHYSKVKMYLYIYIFFLGMAFLMDYEGYTFVFFIKKINNFFH